jgi:hypothetical protein
MTDKVGRVPDGTGLSQADPSRVEIYERGCEAIIQRLEDAQPQHYAETVEELERRHDILADEVRNIAGMIRGLANAIATSEAGDAQKP